MRGVLTLVALLLATAQPSAAAVLNFVLEKSGGNGFAVAEDLDGYHFGFTLFGNSAPTAAPTWTTYSTTVPATGGATLQVAGNWSYITHDTRGPGADTFGYIVNGARFELFDRAGPKSQAGMFSMLLASGDTFGWYVDSVDGLGGRAMVGITADAALSPVPLPAAGFLLLGGVAGLGAAASRRKKRA